MNTTVQKETKENTKEKEEGERKRARNEWKERVVFCVICVIFLLYIVATLIIYHHLVCTVDHYLQFLLRKETSEERTKERYEEKIEKERETVIPLTSHTNASWVCSINLWRCLNPDVLVVSTKICEISLKTPAWSAVCRKKEKKININLLYTHTPHLTPTHTRHTEIHMPSHTPHIQSLSKFYLFSIFCQQFYKNKKWINGSPEEQTTIYEFKDYYIILLLLLSLFVVSTILIIIIVCDCCQQLLLLLGKMKQQGYDFCWWQQ